MKKSFWLKRWETSDIAFNLEAPSEMAVEYIPQLQLKPNATVFVPLCGKTIDMIWLLENNFMVIGVELSEIACEDFFKENKLEYKIIKKNNFNIYQNKNIKLFCGDIFNLTKDLLGAIDAVYDRAALIALPSDMRKNYVNLIAKLINPNTPILLLTIAYENNQIDGPPFSVDLSEIQKLYSDYFDITVLQKENYIPSPALMERGLKTAEDFVVKLVRF